MRTSKCIHTRSAVFPDLLLQLIISRDCRDECLNKFPFVGFEVCTERKLKKQVFELLRFFPSKVKSQATQLNSVGVRWALNL